MKSHIDLLFHICMLAADYCVQIPSASETRGAYHKLIPITGLEGQLFSSAIPPVF